MNPIDEDEALSAAEMPTVKARPAPKRKSLGSSLSKYRAIIISIAIMAVLVVVMGVFNYFVNLQQTRISNKINLAARQAELTQAIAKDVMSLHLLVVAPPSGYNEYSLAESLKITTGKLEHNAQLFTQTLDAFSKGGSVTNVNGQKIVIRAISIPEAQNSLTNSHRMWQPFHQLIESFIQSVNEGKVDRESITFASDYSRLFEGRIFNQMQDLNDHLTEKEAQQARRAQIINGGLLLFAVLLFAYIVLVALRRLLRADEEIAKARRETTEIMDTIEEGLFLIDDNLRIGTQQSRALAGMFPVENLTGKLFSEVIAGMVSEEDMGNTKRFIKQIFNRRVKENLLNDLNPLQEVRILRQNTRGDLEEHYLRFTFSRVMERKKIVHILVKVADITQAMRLQRQLEMERQQNQVQTEMLVKVLKLDQTLLAGFVRRTTNVTQNLNQMLKQSGSTQRELRTKLDDIFREVHSFKGEASALEFDSFVDIAEAAEEKLKKLREKSKLTGEDFIGVAIILDRLIALNEDIAQIQNRLTHFGEKSVAPKTALSANHLTDNLEHFAEQIASRQHKVVHLETQGFDKAPPLSDEISDKLREIMTQLLRNAIVHGIESPELRMREGKEKTGVILLKMRNNSEGILELLVEDDGRGIDFETLREKLRANPRFSGQDVDNFDKKHLYRALFEPGISTAQASSEDAGRGEGMSIIRDRVKQLPAGRISIQSEEGKFTRFIIRFAPN